MLYNNRPILCIFESTVNIAVPLCNPAVQYDDLLRTLNETNDFAGFIRGIRRRFQDLLN